MRKMIDLTGQRFGRLVALELTEKRSSGGAVVWRCRCDCGKEAEVNSHHLRRGNTKSCGCLNNAVDIAGQRFGRLVALEPTEKRSNGSIVWRCRCDCGKVVEVDSHHLRRGNTKSCGCLNNAVDIAGQRFGRLVALEPTEKRSSGSIVWRCRCDCGKVVEADAARLRKGNTKSCGCLKKDRFKQHRAGIDNV